MQPQKSDTEKVLQNDNFESPSHFALSEVGSLYFGPNPSSEAQRLLEQAKELIRENQRIQNEKNIILQEESELRNRKVYLNAENSNNRVSRPNEELQKMLSETITLSEEGQQIDQRKAHLELYYKELKRRKEFLQNAIRIYEESELGQGLSSVSFLDQRNIERSVIL